MTALYRAYRPQRFEDVIGQETVVRTLRNAITSDKVAHAYLFTGSKGTGKTTMAKLLAKAMNCVNGPTIEPCGVCEPCIAIAEGRSVDVAEIDAASNRGIDDVRDKIIDKVAYRPAQGTKRVYILDEAHQITPAAFNALLKTIEEPPDHAVFIFCTTEAHQMMATVRDRCQRLQFAPPGADDIVKALRRAADAEGIVADDTALRSIVRVAQGSFRNGLGTLELLSTAYGGSFTAADVVAHLGAFDEDVLFASAQAVLDGNTGDALRAVEGVAQTGGDLEQLARELAGHLRSLLLATHGVDSVAIVVGDTDRLAQQATDLDEARVLSAIDCLTEAIARIRLGADARLALETQLVRACQGLGLPALAMRLAALEHGASGSYGQPLAAPAAAADSAAAAAPQGGTATAPAPAVAAAAPAPTPAPQVAAEPVVPAAPAVPAATVDPHPAPTATPAAAIPPNPARAAEPVAPTAADAPPAGDDAAPAPASTVADPDDAESWWPAFVASAPARVKPTLQAMHVESFDGRRLTTSSALAGMVTAKQRSWLGEQLTELLGRPVTFEVVEAEAAAPATRAASAPTAQSKVSAPANGWSGDSMPRDLEDQQAARAAIDEADAEAAAPRRPGAAPAVDPAAIAADEARIDLFARTFGATEVHDA